MKVGKTHIYLLACCALLTACSNIEGTYVANHKLGYDTVKIFTDNRYKRIYYTPDKSQSYADTGVWEKSGGAIYFRNWIDRNGMNYSEGKGSSIFGADIDHDFFGSKTKLVINFDLEYYYIKQ